jgi:hydroxyacylglutathione hydrolase
MNQPALILRSATVGAWRENAYVVIDPATNRSLVIDPGAEPATILGLIGDSTVQAILLTHGHRDHIGAVDAIRDQTHAPVMIHPADVELLGGLHVDDHLDDGTTIALGLHTIRAAHTPGHTAGMISLLLPGERAIVGDTIFAGGPGKTWSADGFRATLATLRTILAWPAATACYPGHGPSFRLADLRAQIEAFVNRSHAPGFYGDAEW